MTVDTGREAVVRGVNPGPFTLEISIDDLPPSYHPYIHGQVLEPTVTPIHVYIICDASGTPAVSTATVDAWVAEANRIYKQAAMSFYVAGVEHVVSNEWFEINNGNCSGSRREADGYLREVGGQIRPVRRAMVTRC